MNYGFLAIVSLVFLAMVILVILESRDEKKNNSDRVFIPENYDKKMERVLRNMKASKRNCQRPIRLRQKRGVWIWS